MLEWTRGLPFSRSYLTIVIGVAVAVGGLAIFGRNSTLALAAAILGLYVLHLYSNYQLASDQRQQWQTLREVERMLGALDESPVGGREPPPEASPAPGHGAAEETGRGAPGEGSGGSDASSGPPEAGTAPDADEAAGSSDSSRSRKSDRSPEAAPSVGTAADGDTEQIEDSDAAPEEPRGVDVDRGGRGGEEAEGGEEGVEADEEDDETVLVPRQYKLGTVAVVQRVLTPGEVARVLAVQNRDPDRQFGDIAVELNLLSATELEELLRIQRRGLYRPEAISRARRDLKHYQRQKAKELGTGP